MRDKTEQIFKGAIAVFIKKGLQATTQEVAEKADVAEVTLYRKFSTKENLFVTALKNVLEKKFHSRVMEMAKEDETELFIRKIIENRLEILSKNEQLVKMLISESLRGNLSGKVNLPEIIFTSLKEGLEYHFQYKERKVDIEFCARQLAGIFLSYVTLPGSQPFNKLTKEEKKDIVEKHAKSVLAVIENREDNNIP